jgi:hypothetical protein
MLGDWGETDNLSKEIVSHLVNVPDLFATVCAGVGIHPNENLFDCDRPVPITDRGQPIYELF